jgi:hypothetical protein
MAKTPLATVKLPAQLVDLARAEAAVFSRSISGQLEHWARIGRAMENAPGFTLDRARAAIEGRLDPALLSDEECRYYYDLLGDALANPGLEVKAAARRRGRSVGAAGYDDAGRLVRREADGSLTVVGE